jgi:hypothetical protein
VDCQGAISPPKKQNPGGSGGREPREPNPKLPNLAHTGSVSWPNSSSVWGSAPHSPPPRCSNLFWQDKWVMGRQAGLAAGGCRWEAGGVGRKQCLGEQAAGRLGVERPAHTIQGQLIPIATLASVLNLHRPSAVPVPRRPSAGQLQA